jgi:hypothetical protein
MKTAIRSSTLWRTLVFLIVVIAPARAFAAGAPTPAPTPAGESYFITWNETAKGTARRVESNGLASCEYRQSGASNGAAIVRFKYEGNPPELKRYSRIISGNLTDEWDEKHHDVKSDCGDYVAVDDHYSYQPIEPIIGMDWWMEGPPEKQVDGSWLIPDVYNGESAFLGTHSGSYRLIRKTTTCYAPCTMESPAGCVAHGASALHSHTDSLTLKSMTPRPVIDYDTFPHDAFNLKSSDPDFFTKEVEADAYGQCGGKPLKVKWEITVRRIGKCRIGNSIPIIETASQSNPDINGEDIEIGVEHGIYSIDPDKGVAALNIRVTCDQVPIKNAKVDVGVFASAGGHQHSAGRPRGSLEWNGVETKLTDVKPSIEVKTDDDGRAHLSFKPGKAENYDKYGIAGNYEITASPVRFPLRTAKVAVEAKVDGLSPIDADSTLADDCGDDGHMSGDNATATTKQQLVKFASAFHDAQQAHIDELAACKAPQWKQWKIYPLWAIDASLPWGGLYDVKANWKTSHQTHGRGDGVDFSISRGWPNPDNKFSICAIDPSTGTNYRISPQGWLLMKMSELGEPKYGTWDNTDLNDEPLQRWHLHVKQNP